MAEGIETEGRTRLVAWMGEDPSTRTQGFIARKLNISQPAVRAWVKGLSRPEPHFREPLEVLCGIPRAAWELPEEHEKRAAALANIRAENDADHGHRSESSPELKAVDAPPLADTGTEDE